MFLKSLELNNFRNVSKISLTFDKNINIFIGNNAQGKTNILESIYFLAITRSHRTNNDLNLIKSGELYTKLSGTYQADDSTDNTLSILLNERGKKVSVNNLVQRKISNYLSRLNVIMFCPDDLEIIKGSPSVRRRFLNIELSQLRNDYLILLKEYHQILKQRNEYLKQKNNARFDRTYFGILTEKLIDKNVDIIKIRYDFINQLNGLLPSIFSRITQMGELRIEYKSFVSEGDLRKEDVKETLLKRYNNLFTNELLQKTTLLGCHKDDFKVYLNGLDITEFGSQGQQRLSVLCLKLAEIEVFVKNKNTHPIILLDDIFSELDEKKKNNIIDYFDEEVQIFITTTEISEINKKLNNKANVYVVENGVITKEELKWTKIKNIMMRRTYKF